MQNKKYTFSAILLLLAIMAVGQNYNQTDEEERVEERYHILSFTIGYGYEISGGDLKDRYGNSPKFTLGGQYLTPKNYFYEFDFNLIFGNDVKEDILKDFRNKNGFLIGVDGGLTEVFLRERGYFLGGVIGKLFSPGDYQSGVRVGLGIGVLSHNIRVLDESKTIGQLSGDYLKGYDRLTRGLALKQQLGYELHSKDGRINLNLMFEITEAFTKSVRKYQFDIGSDTANRLDLLYGIRANWMLPLKRISTTKQTIYY